MEVRCPLGKDCKKLGHDQKGTEEQLKGLFWRFDKNRDGRLNKEELKAAFKELGAIFPGFRAYRGLHHADDNGDGYINDEEVDKLVKYTLQSGYKVN